MKKTIFFVISLFMIIVGIFFLSGCKSFKTVKEIPTDSDVSDIISGGDFKKAEKILALGNTSRMKTLTGHSFLMPGGYAGKRESIEVNSLTDIDNWLRDFQNSSYFEGYVPLRSGKIAVAYLEKSSHEAKILKVVYNINNHIREMMIIYVEDFNLAIILVPGSDYCNKHGLIAALCLKTLS